MNPRIGRFFYSLSGRLLLTHMLVAFAVLLMTGVLLGFAAGPLQRELVFRRLDDVLRVGGLLARNPALQGWLQPGQAPDGAPSRADNRLQHQAALLAEQAAAQNVRLLVIDRATAQILLDTNGTHDGERWPGLLPAGPLHNARRLPRDAPPPIRERGLAAFDNTIWFYRTERLPPHPNSDLVLMALQPRQPWRRALFSLLADLPMRPVLFSGASLLLLIWLLSAGIARLLSQSLAPVIAGTHAIAAGELSYRVPEDASSLWEVTTLAQSFNHMAQEVQRSRQAQRDFVANVGHDLKTPLTGIQGFAGALLDGTAATPTAQQRAAHIIYEDTQRLVKLVDEILALARVDSDQFQLDTHPIDLREHLSQLAAAYAARSSESQVTLRWQRPVEPLMVQADPDALERVCMNLLDNAFCYTEPGGTITITAAAQGDTVETTIADTGQGIPEEDVPRIFERFYQVNKSRSGPRGSGLGLSIVKEIVEAHGGTVEVMSKEGVGSQFCVRLPRA